MDFNDIKQRISMAAASPPDQELFASKVKIIPTKSSFCNLDSTFAVVNSCENFILQGDYVVSKFDNTANTDHLDEDLRQFHHSIIVKCCSPLEMFYAIRTFQTSRI